MTSSAKFSPRKITVISLVAAQCLLAFIVLLAIHLTRKCRVPHRLSRSDTVESVLMHNDTLNYDSIVVITGSTANNLL